MRSLLSWPARLYSPLKKSPAQIRLLRFNKPSTGDNKISLSLFKDSLDSNPNFVALSYEWGDPSNVAEILINNKPLAVTRNLVSALTELKSQFSDQTFWIDAICINQADVEERNHQVTLMRRIYQQAAIVFSWLGDPDDTSVHAVKMMRSLYRTWIEQIGDQIEDASNVKDLKGIDEVDHVWQELSNGIHALNALFSRPYWSRIWILQETMLAKHLIFVCGPDAFTLEQLSAAAAIVMLASQTSGHYTLDTRMLLSSAPLPGVYRRLAKMPSSMKILFSLTRTFHATDPRDHVYGILGIIDLKIQPDYSKPTRDVYCAFAQLWVMQTTHLDILLFAGTALTFEQHRTEGLPTWVPDWYALSESYQEFFQSKLSASAGITTEVNFSTKLDTMSLAGICCDEVISIVPQEHDTDDHTQLVIDYSWSMLLHPGETIAYCSNMTRIHAIFRLIYERRYESLLQDPAKLRRGAFFYCGMLSMAGPIDDLIAKLPPHESDSMIEDLCKDNGDVAVRQTAIMKLCMRFGESVFADLNSVWSMIDNSSSGSGLDVHTDFDVSSMVLDLSLSLSHVVPFHTSKGYFGGIQHCLPPQEPKEVFKPKSRLKDVVLPGDLICVVGGHNMPILLRRQDSHFIFIGRCMVPGLMEGEAMDMVHRGDAQMEVFDIR